MIRFKEGLVYEAALKGQPEKLAATTCFPNSNPRDGFAILVSYVARVSKNIMRFSYLQTGANLINSFAVVFPYTYSIFGIFFRKLEKTVYL